MVIVTYKNGTTELMNSERLQYILQIKNIRSQVITYKYL